MGKIKPLPRHRIKYRHKAQFAIIVVCLDEKAQRRAFIRLQRQGYNVRVVTV